MPDPETPASPPEAALSAQFVACRVVGVRPPEPAVSRSFGAITATGLQIACMTTYAARRAEVAALVRPVDLVRDPHDPLAGPLPPRGSGEPRSAVAVRVTQK